MSKGGPNSEAGKAVSRRNATSHGIFSQSPVVGVETEADWQRHLSGMFESLQPEGHHETVLVERIAYIVWRQNRVTRYETEVSKSYLEGTPDHMIRVADYGKRKLNIPVEVTITPDSVGAMVERRMLPGETDLVLIMRYETHIHRLYLQLLHELEAIQARRKGGNPLLTRVDMSGPPA